MRGTNLEGSLSWLLRYPQMGHGDGQNKLRETQTMRKGSWWWHFLASEDDHDGSHNDDERNTVSEDDNKEGLMVNDDAWRCSGIEWVQESQMVAWQCSSWERNKCPMKEKGRNRGPSTKEATWKLRERKAAMGFQARETRIFRQEDIGFSPKILLQWSNYSRDIGNLFCFREATRQDFVSLGNFFV